MPVSADMLEHLESNVTFLCQLWKITARDGTVAAYASHTRNLTYDGVLYKATANEPSRPVRVIGLEPDTAELTGVFDSIITEDGIVNGKWKNAEIVKEIVNYTDLTMGSVLRQKGVAGQFSIRNGTYTVEFQSNASLLKQEIGDLTSPIDRNRRVEDLGVNVVSFTFAATVTAVTNRRQFKVGYVQPSADYFAHGLADWQTGANSNLEMEVKSSTTTDGGTRTEIVLHLPMRSTIAIGDTLNLIAGYDGTRAMARDRFGATAVLNMQAEPDLPGLNSIISYPE